MSESSPSLLYLSWKPAYGIPVTTYNIFYSNCDKKCFNDTKIINVNHSTNNYSLQVEEDTVYSVQVTIVHEDHIFGSRIAVVTTKPVGNNDSSTHLVIITTGDIYFPCSAPSVGPDVTVSNVTSSTITIQWGMIPCIHQNGNITGYSVTIDTKGTGSTQTLGNLSGASTTLLHLTPETTYEIRVAGVNTEGIGVSTNISATTLTGTNELVIFCP